MIVIAIGRLCGSIAASACGNCDIAPSLWPDSRY
jgi:hypothetical protein